MSSRNDDIKQLFNHLGLNQEDYLELRRKGGGTESERAPQAEPNTAAQSHVTKASTVRSSVPEVSRFNAQSQPKVFLPGLTPNLGAPEQPPATVSRPVRTKVEPDVTVHCADPVLSPQATTTTPEKRWPMLDAARASSNVAQLKPKAAVVRPAAADDIREAAGVRRWAGLDQRPLATQVRAEPEVVEEMAVPAADEDSSLKRVLGRLANPEMTNTDRHRVPQLHYSPRPLATPADEAESGPSSSELGAVLGRLGRVRR